MDITCKRETYTPNASFDCWLSLAGQYRGMPREPKGLYSYPTTRGSNVLPKYFY